MADDHRRLHAAEWQTGMHVPWGKRPSCYCAENPQWPCGAAETPDLWAALTTHSPGCAGCAKSRLAQDIYWGLSDEKGGA